MRQFKSYLLWQAFVHTDRFRAVLFKLSWRPSAVAFELIQLRLQKLPYKLFNLLLPGIDTHAEARSLLATPPCLRDEFSQSSLAKYDNIATLPEERGQACTHTTERLHSRNLRVSKSRVCTHRANIPHLAINHCGFAFPPWLEPECNKAGDTSSSTRKRGRPTSDSKEVKARRGGGGAWRAFLAVQLAGQRMTGERVKEVKETFDALSPEMREHWQSVGRAGMSAA
eukprot:3982638-Amphidinium_carterae.1